MATVATYATYIKELMANMPDDLDNKKEIDLYYKTAIKATKEKMKEENKTAKAAKAAKKKGKKENTDSDSNDEGIVKVKRAPSAYQIFLKENRETVKEENPGLTGKEYAALLATMWGKHKEDNA